MNKDMWVSEDMWIYIFRNCDSKYIINIAQVCKWFNKIIKSKNFIHYLSKEKKQKLLIEACEKNNIKIVKILLKDYDVNISAKNNFAIKMARLNNYTKIVNILIEKGGINKSVVSRFELRCSRDIYGNLRDMIYY